MLICLDVRTFDLFSNDDLAIVILLFISDSHLPSSFAMYPRYSMLLTYWIGFLSITMLNSGTESFLPLPLFC